MGIVKLLAKELGKKEREIFALLLHASLYYKVYKIPKRTYGTRTIAQPTAKLKELQRAFLSLNPLPVHDVAMAYRSGLSIKDNAQAHKKNHYFLKLDLYSFFNSINPEIFWNEWDVFFDTPDTIEKKLIERLLFWSPSKNLSLPLMLSVGAPSSPSVSNFVMYRFDVQLSSICNKRGIVYTRYADDLTFSTRNQGVLQDMPDMIAGLLMQFFGTALAINRRKTFFSSKAHNRHVTGITITNENKISLGRQRKRYIKHLVHQFVLKKLCFEDVNHLRGLLSFAKHIEPSFIYSLEKKYGLTVLAAIKESNHE